MSRKKKKERLYFTSRKWIYYISGKFYKITKVTPFLSPPIETLRNFVSCIQWKGNLGYEGWYEVDRFWQIPHPFLKTKTISFLNMCSLFWWQHSPLILKKIFLLKIKKKWEIFFLWLHHPIVCLKKKNAFPFLHSRYHRFK